MKTKTKAYSQPLLSIFADVDEITNRSSIVFVWKKGDALDIEVERDEESQFPSGKAGYSKSKVLYRNPFAREAAKRALCLTLGKEVFLKISRRVHMLEVNPVFKEALVQAKCAHPNVCDLLDFRLYRGKQNNFCAYIVMEWLEKDLAMEIQERKLRPYDEAELMTILQQVVAALLNAKRQGLTHQNIMPHNILRGPQGLKLAGFGSTWLKGSRISSILSTEVYISPEAWEAIENPETQLKQFESDVFSLGMTMLHLAAMELPERTSAIIRSKQQDLLQRKVQTLSYSEGLKRLLTGMLSIAPGDRPPLETVQMSAERIYPQGTQILPQEAHRHRPPLETVQMSAERIYPQETQILALEAHRLRLQARAVAARIYSWLPEEKYTVWNLREWEDVLEIMKRVTEALGKYEAAHAILSRLSEDKDTANNLREWGDALRVAGRGTEALEKYEAAHTILSRLPQDRDFAKNLLNWGVSLKIGEGGQRQMKST